MATYMTIGVNDTRVDREVERATFVAIEGVNHLTPATEAAMENCLRPDEIAALEAKTIKRNSQGSD